MKAVDNPQECVKAAYNYAAMHGQFHPIDWLPKALLKVMLDKLFKGPPTVEQPSRLFEKYISENGGRAQKNGVPLTYMEIVGLWNTFIVPSSINMVLPTLFQHPVMRRVYVRGQVPETIMLKEDPDQQDLWERGTRVLHPLRGDPAQTPDNVHICCVATTVIIFDKHAGGGCCLVIFHRPLKTFLQMQCVIGSERQGRGNSLDNW
jgi:hypothetical protein